MMGAGTGHVPVKAIAFGAIDDERYEESFSACLLSDSQLARNLQARPHRRAEACAGHTGEQSAACAGADAAPARCCRFE